MELDGQPHDGLAVQRGRRVRTTALDPELPLATTPGVVRVDDLTNAVGQLEVEHRTCGGAKWA